MRETINYWGKAILGWSMLSLFLFPLVYGLRQCSESTQNVGTSIGSVAPLAIKQNTEIVALNQRIEALENKIDSLNYTLQKIDSARNENFVNTPNQSNRKSYSDITKRYIK